MNRFSKWLNCKFSRHSAEADERHTSLGLRLAEYAKEENSGSDQITAPLTRTSPKKSSYIVVESTDFDPYNSGSFETSKARSNN